MDKHRYNVQLGKIDVVFKIMIVIAELALASFAIFQGIYISYPSFINKTVEELTPRESRFLLQMSTAYRISGVILNILDAMTAVLLFISMRRIYITITTYYPLWNANRFFITLQGIAFIGPLLFAILALAFYKPQANYDATLTYAEMLAYCLF